MHAGRFSRSLCERYSPVAPIKLGFDIHRESVIRDRDRRVQFDSLYATADLQCPVEERSGEEDAGAEESKGHGWVVFDIEEVNASQMTVAFRDSRVDRSHISRERAGDAPVWGDGPMALYGAQRPLDLKNPHSLCLEGDGRASRIEDPRTNQGDITFGLHLKLPPWMITRRIEQHTPPALIFDLLSRLGLQRAGCTDFSRNASYAYPAHDHTTRCIRC